MIYLHQRLVHAPVRLLSPAMRQYMLELALQVVILHEEREVEIADAEAVFARIIPMTRVEAGEGIGTYEIQHLWWQHECQSSPLFALFAFGVDDVDALRRTFGNYIDVAALDHLRTLRMAEERFRMDWRFEVTEADHSNPQNLHCRVRFAGPFYLTTEEVEGRQVILFPMGTHVWNGTMADGRRMELRLDDAFNLSIVHTFDPHLPDREPRVPPPREAEDTEDARGMEVEDRDPENNYEGEERYPLSPGPDNDN